MFCRSSLFAGWGSKAISAGFGGGKLSPAFRFRIGDSGVWCLREKGHLSHFLKQSGWSFPLDSQLIQWSWRCVEHLKGRCVVCGLLSGFTNHLAISRWGVFSLLRRRDRSLDILGVLAASSRMQKSLWLVCARSKGASLTGDVFRSAKLSGCRRSVDSNSGSFSMTQTLANPVGWQSSSQVPPQLSSETFRPGNGVGWFSGGS